MTPGTRHKVIGTFDDITSSTPEKSLLAPLKNSGGRNNSGKMTVRYIGGGHKKMYRVIDFKRDKDTMAATVKTIEYDPNRSARIALLAYPDGEKRYMLAPNGLKVGQVVSTGAGAAPEVGNTLFLADIPLGTVVHNIELYPGQGAAMARSAGTYAQLLAREGKFAIIKLPSGETRMVLVTCRATIGAVSNPDHSLESHGKPPPPLAGRRPRNRGVTMNPVDHPMGGGKDALGRPSPLAQRFFWPMAYKTRNPKKTTSKFIVSGRKNKFKIVA